MLELARLVGTPPKGIILQTRERHNVANSQSCEPDLKTHNDYDKFRKKHNFWINRKPACGVYNCFGMVWASRRTAIYEESDISLILRDDGYRQLLTESQLQPGDIVLYRKNGDTRHAAMVMEIRPLGSSMVPWVLSKWNDSFGEDLHTLWDIPEILKDCLIEFWTDRPL